MSDLRREELTLGWYHPGFIRGRSGIATSTEHRRLLHLVNDTADHLIGATLLAASLAGQVGKATISPTAPSDSSEWRRIAVEPNEALTKAGLRIVRQAIGEASLTHAVYMGVKSHDSEGNAAVQAVMRLAEESGFRNPVGLLDALPVIEQKFPDYPDNSPAQRIVPAEYPQDAQGVFGLLPDLEAAIQASLRQAATIGTVHAHLVHGDYSHDPL